MTGGGTAGHVIPHLAMIDDYKKLNLKIYYIGSYNGLERGMLQQYPEIHYTPIFSGKLRRYWSLDNFLDVFKILFGCLQALYWLMKIRPKMVFSKGGYVSVPVAVSAWALGIPVYTHESDYSPGLATKIIMRFAKKVFCAFEDTQQKISQNRKVAAVWTGIPIRKNLLLGDKNKALKLCDWDSPGPKEDFPVLLIMGGSLGAQFINEGVEKNFEVLCQQFKIIHLTGKGKAVVGLKHRNYCQFEFLGPELADVFALADFVISRAGATAIFELLFLNKPMLLIPLGKSSRGDQIENAHFFTKKSWAMMLGESEIERDSVMFMKSLYLLRNNSASMIQNMRNQADIVKRSSNIILKEMGL